MMNDLELLFRFDRIGQLWITIFYYAQAMILIFLPLILTIVIYLITGIPEQ